MNAFQTEYNTVCTHNMLSENDGVVIGLSGGADSVYLLYCLLALKDVFKLKLYAAHVNHNIRGAEAERDRAFAEDLCLRLNIPCYVKSVDVPKLAAEEGKTIEECGRIVRYDFFAEVMKKTGANKIATAHHKNDSTETVLMNIIRGTGFRGLCGIPPIRGAVIRPLLETDKSHITGYLDKHNIKYVTDSTNNQNDYFRNSIRNRLIPQIKQEYNPNFDYALAHLSHISKGVNRFIEEEVLPNQKIFRDDYGVFINLADLISHNEAILCYIIKNMIYELSGRGYDISFEHYQNVIALINNNATGKRTSLPFGMEAEIVYDKLYLKYPQKTPHFCFELPIGGSISVPEISATVSTYVRDFSYSPGKDCIALNMEKLKGKELKIRNRMAGDRFRPTGLNGTKKLKDYFIDEKTPQYMRTRIPVITSDGVIAAVGTRVSEEFKPKRGYNQLIIEINNK